MAKTLAEALALIQDPEAKTLLESQISNYSSKAERLDKLEADYQSRYGAKFTIDQMEVIARPVADGWKKYDSDLRPKVEKELVALKEELNRLKPEAEAAALLRKQLADEGKTVLDPKDIRESLKSDFLSAADRQKIVDEAVKLAVDKAKESINFGSLPTGMKILEQADRARREFGLNIPIETFSEAVSRHGGVDQAYNALTAEAAAKKAADNQAAIEARHKADIEKAREEGLRAGRAEADMRAYNPEEGSSSGLLPMVPPQDNKELQGVNPQSYNPSDGTLAREAAQRLAKQEADGLWGNQRVM